MSGRCKFYMFEGEVTNGFNINNVVIRVRVQDLKVENLEQVHMYTVEAAVVTHVVDFTSGRGSFL